MARKDVPKFITAIDFPEMRFHKFAGFFPELVDQKCPATADGFGGFGRNYRAEIIGQRREGQAGEYIICLFKPGIANDLIHIRRRSMHSDKPAIAEGFPQISYKVFIQVDDKQGRAGLQPIEHRLTECADARAIFDKEIAIFPIDRREHFIDGQRGGRND